MRAQSLSFLSLLELHKEGLFDWIHRLAETPTQGHRSASSFDSLAAQRLFEASDYVKSKFPPRSLFDCFESDLSYPRLDCVGNLASHAPYAGIYERMASGMPHPVSELSYLGIDFY